MSTPTPTPTPYRLEIDPRAGIDYQVRIHAGEGLPTVALIVQPDYCQGNDNSSPYARAKANAEFIVRACNSHAGLVSALNVARNMLVQLGMPLPGNRAAGKNAEEFNWPQWQEHATQIRNELAKLEVTS